MNRLKAVINYEMRTVRWFLAIAVLFAVFGAYLIQSTSSQMQTNVDAMYGLYANNISTNYIMTMLSSTADMLKAVAPYLLICIGLMITLLFARTNKQKTREFMASLPVKRNEYWVVKVVMGYGVILFSWIVFTVLILVTRAINITEMREGWILTGQYELLYRQDTVANMMLLLVYFLFIMTAVYAIFVAMNSVINKTVIALIVGTIATGAPALCSIALKYYVLNEYQNLHATIKLSDDVLNRWGIVNNRYLGVLWGTGYAEMTNVSDNYHSYDFIVMNEMCVRLIVLGVVIAGCIVLGYMANQKKNTLSANQIIDQKVFRIVCGVCVGICCAVVFVFMFGENFPIIVNGIISVVITVAVFYLTNKLLKINVGGE